MGALARLKAIPPWVWLLLVAVGGTVVMIWHRYYQDDQDRDWLDPQQPPVNVTIPVNAAASLGKGVGLRPYRAPKLYPAGNLTEHPQCWVGDC